MLEPQLTRREDDLEVKTVGEIVAADYRAADIFQRLGIDFCCGGDIPLAEACREHGVDLQALRQELQELAHVPGRGEQYDQWALDFLADYIVNQHHAYARQMTPLLRDYAAAVAQAHGAEHPETLTIAGLFEELSGELAMHMQKEELLLFPYIRRLLQAQGEGPRPATPPFGSAQKLIQAMDEEHDETGDLLAQIEALSSGYTPPEDACNTYRALYANLKAFDADTKKHVHLENNILFPKTIQLEGELVGSGNGSSH